MNPPPPLPLPNDFADWHSPMVVKELRHGLRTRFFAVALIQFHVLLALLMGSALLGADQEIISGVFWVLALVVMMVVMPLRGFSALTSEVSEGTLDMLRLTNMPAFRVVFGKWAALFSQTLLIASSLLPYVVARYHFGGVELMREAAGLVIMVLASAVTTAAVVSFSTQKSILLRLGLLGGLLMGVFPLLAFVVSMMFRSNPVADVFMSLPGAEQTWAVAGVLFATCYVTYLFLTLGASRFASPAEDHTRVKRLVGLGVMGVLTGAGVSLALWHPSRDAAAWVYFPTMVFVLVLGMDIMTETMPRVPSVVAKSPRGGGWRRLAGRLLYPGWASGLLFYLLLCLAPMGVAAAVATRFGETTVLQVTLCVLLANVVPVTAPVSRGKLFQKWWVVQLVLLICGCLLLLLAEVMRVEAIAALGVITPLTALLSASASSKDEMIAGGAIAGGFWLVGALYLAITEMRVYRELEIDAQYGEDLKPQPSAAHDLSQ